MTTYPVSLNLTNQPVLVVGGGQVACRRLTALIDAGARITLVAPLICSAIEVLADRYPEQLDCQRRLFAARVYRQSPAFRLIIAAASQETANRQAAGLARQMNALLIDAGDVDRGNALTPAVIRRGPITLAIDTAGQSPSLTRSLRRWIAERLPSGLERMVAALAQLRQELLDADVDRGQVRRTLRYWSSAQQWPALLTQSRQPDHPWVHASDTDALQPSAQVSLVGAGPGDPELLTVRAVNRLASADVVLHDQLVSAEILSLSRADAQRIPVGKQSGGHQTEQALIHRLMIEHARAGRRVVRLKGGDPLIFGRGGEELLALSHAGIRVELVAGISAAIGCAASVGIPLTHRHLAQSCHFITAHLDQSAEQDWSTHGRDDDTLVIYMGVSRASQISAGLIAAGRFARTPVAIVERGTTADERIVTGVLADLPSLVREQQIRSPALIIVGRVINVYHQLKATEGKVDSTEVFAEAMIQPHRSAT